ncbi:MAG: hypothetical protein Q4G67_01715 [Actinomycetia bacterium]|nr:hypothetical protein [Actinomycetes bacterium]
MYAALWRSLPGPWPVKVLIALVLFAAIVFALFTWVFPELAPYVPFNDTTVGEH